jgi:hypothetical protein
MLNDTIVDEIHQFRAQLLERHRGNFAAYFATLVKKQQQHPERYTSFAQSAGTPQPPVPDSPASP